MEVGPARHAIRSQPETGPPGHRKTFTNLSGCIHAGPPHPCQQKGDDIGTVRLVKTMVPLARRLGCDPRRHRHGLRALGRSTALWDLADGAQLCLRRRDAVRGVPGLCRPQDREPAHPLLLALPRGLKVKLQPLPEERSGYRTATGEVAHARSGARHDRYICL